MQTLLASGVPMSDVEIVLISDGDETWFPLVDDVSFHGRVVKDAKLLMIKEQSLYILFKY